MSWVMMERQETGHKYSALQVLSREVHQDGFFHSTLRDLKWNLELLNSGLNIPDMVRTQITLDRYTIGLHTFHDTVTAKYRYKKRVCEMLH